MRPKNWLTKWQDWFKSLVLVTLVVTAVCWLRSDFWQIKKVTCSVNGDVCSPELWSELMNLTAGKNGVFLSSSKLIDQLKLGHPNFFEIKVDKRLPDELVFEIEVRQPVVAVGSDKNDYFLSDLEGILLAQSQDNQGLPVIKLESKPDLEIGQKIQDDQILMAISLLLESQLRLLEPKLANLISDRSIELEFENGTKVLFSNQKSLSDQLNSLQLILERIRIEGNQLKKVDLRFDKPVLVAR